MEFHPKKKEREHKEERRWKMKGKVDTFTRLKNGVQRPGFGDDLHHEQ